MLGLGPIEIYNASQVARTTPAQYPASEALDKLGAAFNQRVDKLAPGRNIDIAPEFNTPTKNPLQSLLAGEINQYASSDRTTKPTEYNLNINPNVDRAILAHELGHVASDQTKVGNMIRSARNNPKLTKMLGAAALLGAGGSAALTSGDDDLALSVAAAYAGAAPIIADEILASKNGLAMLDTAGMRASLGQRGRLAANLMSYLGAPLLLGTSANFAGNLMDDELVGPPNQPLSNP